MTPDQIRDRQALAERDASHERVLDENHAAPVHTRIVTLVNSDGAQRRYPVPADYRKRTVTLDGRAWTVHEIEGPHCPRCDDAMRRDASGPEFVCVCCGMRTMEPVWKVES